MRVATLVAIVTMTALPAFAQTAIYVGPQIGIQGIGLSAEVDLGMLSVSGELGYVPVNSVTYDQNGNEFALDVKPLSGLLMVNFSPGSGRFTLGAGLLAGGLNGDGEATNLRGGTEIGENLYPAGDIGTLNAEVEFGSFSPAVMVGLRKAGFNVGIGVAFSGSPKYTLSSTGSLQNDPQFLNDLDIDIEDVQETFDKIPVLPLLRIGWQIGVMGQSN